MSHFAFKHPLILLNLLWIPLWLWVCFKRWHNHKFIPVSSLRNFPFNNSHPHRIPQFFRALTLSTIIIALARPQGITSHFQNKTGVDILLALDLSSSMQIPDFSINQLQRTSRIQAAKAVLEEFIRKRSHDRIGLVAFARYPYLVSPLTLNHSWLLKNLERLNAGLVEDGTAIGSAVAMCVNRLKNLQAKTRLVILLTDGVNNFGDVSPMLAAEIAETFKTKIYTIMVGSDQIFPVDEQTLVRMAEKTGGRFYKAYDIHSLKQIYQEIDQLEKTKIQTSDYNEYAEFFPAFLCLAFFFLLCEFLLKQYRYRVLS